MTLEELRIEAKKQGYKLIKDNKYEALIPCICGCNRRIRWYNTEGQVSMECSRPMCDIRTPWADSEAEVRRKWNKMIKEMMRENCDRSGT